MTVLDELEDDTLELETYPYRIVVDEATDEYDEGDVVFGSMAPIEDHKKDRVAMMEELVGTPMRVESNE